MNVHFCNGCGKQRPRSASGRKIENGWGKVFVKFGRKGVVRKMHLCPSCKGNFDKIVTNMHQRDPTDCDLPIPTTPTIVNPAPETASLPTSTDGFRAVSLELIEQEQILGTLSWTNWNKSQAAQILGIERSTLDRKLKKYEAERPR